MPQIVAPPYVPSFLVVPTFDSAGGRAYLMTQLREAASHLPGGAEEFMRSNNRVGDLRLPATAVGLWCGNLLRLLRLEEMVMIRDLALYDQFNHRPKLAFVREASARACSIC